MKRYRVAHIITRLCKGGAQENTFHTVRLANRDRFEVDLISGPTYGEEGTIEPAIQSAGIAILREPALIRPIAPLRDLIALRRLTRLFRERRYDIVHTHTSKAGWLGRLAAERAGVPIVVHTPHGNVFHGYFSKPVSRLFVWLERYAARRTDRIIELTARGIEEHLEEHIGRREQFRVIFSGIDFTPFHAARENREATRAALGIPNGAFLAGGVGRLEPVKGFTYFVAAAQAIAREIPEAAFILAGSGALEAELRAQAAPLGEQFRFLGLREDIPALMAAMDVLIAPSLNEGMGRVLLEAGGAGIPSIASAVGGIPDVIVDGSTGILVPPRDPEAIARAASGLARDPERRRAMGELARAMAEPAYGIDRMVEQIEALYDELIREKQLER